MTTLLPIASGRRTGRLLLDLLRPRTGLVVLATGILVAATVAGLVVQPLLGHIVDLIADGRGTGALVLPVGLIAGAALVQAALTTAGVALVARAGESTLADLRERFVDRALHLPLARIEAAGSGDLTSRVTNDVSKIGEAVREAFPEFARSALAIVLTLAGLAVLDWRFLLAALAGVPIQALTVRWYLRRAAPLYAQQRAAAGALQQELLETMSGAATVRAFRMSGRRLARLTDRGEHAVDLGLRAVRLQTAFFARLNVAEYLGLSSVLVTGYLMVHAGTATIGTATAAALYFHSLFTPINTALVLIDDAQSAAASLTRLAGVADRPASTATAPDGAGRGDYAVRVKGVGHSYLGDGGKLVLEGVDLDLGAGQRIALVGASGAGKSTLAALIAGIHRPVQGSISIGGRSLDELGPAGVRRLVGLVTQEVHVFAGPLVEDLRLARADATVDDVRAALARVEALTWVDALPEGLRTVVGDGGHRLTAGQAQQLALARLILADPPVAILDEATAEAGSAGAALLERAALNALEGRTSLVVAHRLTQAASADRVVLLEAGQVAEQGTHDELVAAGGPYARLWAAYRP